MMKSTVTVIITVKSPCNKYIRDTREVHIQDLIQAISQYISRGFEIIAIEELNGCIVDFYSKRLNDDDLDCMASEIS